MALVCPHCHNALDLGECPPPEEVLCPVCGSSFRLEPAATTDWSGRDERRTLGKYQLLEAVGAGAFGTVYKARDGRPALHPAPAALPGPHGPGLNRLAPQPAPQVLGQFTSRGVTPACLLGHRLEADGFQVFGDVVVEAARPARFIVEHLV